MLCLRPIGGHCVKCCTLTFYYLQLHIVTWMKNCLISSHTTSSYIYRVVFYSCVGFSFTFLLGTTKNNDVSSCRGTECTTIVFFYNLEDSFLISLLKILIWKEMPPNSSEHKILQIYLHSKFSTVIFKTFLYVWKPCWHVYGTLTSPDSNDVIVKIEVRFALSNFSEYFVSFTVLPFTTNTSTLSPLLQCLWLVSVVLSSKVQCNSISFPNTAGLVAKLHDTDPVINE